ncbi:hypothetical protein [Thermocrinis minervae]|uniref:Uncharacterized protein n=1 Tax=Thermocrinis minervae TaxID=381751 RepID=A0A1M6Q1I9_9AQUI|nr:hypothetical protein [Thermocrinis minervae]SHK14079.1 hypothetical protein SAMN05444391_0041 [Thermocrinis minervae]
MVLYIYLCVIFLFCLTHAYEKESTLLGQCYRIYITLDREKPKKERDVNGLLSFLMEDVKKHMSKDACEVHYRLKHKGSMWAYITYGRSTVNHTDIYSVNDISVSSSLRRVFCKSFLKAKSDKAFLVCNPSQGFFLD